MLEQQCGYYVYGIAENTDSQRGGSDSRWGGISNPAPTESCDGLPKDGVDPSYPVQALPYRDIQAIVSKVSLDEFGQEALEENLRNPDWLEAKVRAHEGVLETVLVYHTVVPMRFGTIFRSESRVQEMLTRCYDDFVDTLARLVGKKEWGVKVYADDSILAERASEFSDRVRELEAAMAEKSGGAAYLWKKRLEGIVAAEIERIRDECAERTHDHLSNHAEESAVSPLLSRQVTARTEDMILNGSYLVSDERFGAFWAGLTGLQESYSALGFSFQTSGPWPPYNFVQMSEGHCQ